MKDKKWFLISNLVFFLCMICISIFFIVMRNYIANEKNYWLAYVGLTISLLTYCGIMIINCLVMQQIDKERDEYQIEKQKMLNRLKKLKRQLNKAKKDSEVVPIDNTIISSPINTTEEENNTTKD